VTSNETFLLGAVAYDPKVVTIWTGFRDWFTRQGFPFDYMCCIRTTSGR
jgi:phosphonate transport system substrate-binding protein